MRRYLAGALLLLMLAESAGSAVASGPGASAGSGDLAAAIAPLESAIVSSRLYADLTGSGGRYAAMHAPAPAMERPHALVGAAAIMRTEHPLHPVIRHGVERKIIMPPRSALDPRHRRLDPLAMRRSTVGPASFLRSSESSTGLPSLPEPLQPLGVSSPFRGAQRQVRARKGGRISPQTASDAGAGIEHWWTYEERPIPGIGKAMVNVGTGNLLVTADDVDVPEQGIDLAFRRVYNAQSLHDANGDDGGDPSIFGNRWTNNLDASIIYNSAANTMTVYDLEGTPCVYIANVNAPGGWQPCTGEYATLVPTDGTDCTYAWTKPNGTVYWFHSDVSGSGCSIVQAKKGQLEEILARNQINEITFSYSYNGQGQSSEDVTQIVATHSDGDKLTMNFGVIQGTSINELTTIVLPNGVSELQYSYDSSGNVLEVDKPGNNSASATNVPQNHDVPDADAPETYAYVSGTSTLQEACGPICTVAMWNHPNNPQNGSALLLTFNNSLQLTTWQVQGILNFTPTDKTSTPLQSGYPTSFQAWYTANFVYGSGSRCGNASSGTTTMCDTDGHSTIWTIDGSDRVTQTQDWTGAAEGQWLVKSQTWDPNNNLTSTTDANGNTTNYGYDNNPQQGFSCCGNMVEEQLPQASDFTINGQAVTLSPLSFYSYDLFFNVTAYCDAVWSQRNNKSWSNSPTDNLCAGNGSFSTFAFSTDGQSPDANEPYGCLTSMTKPGGYQSNVWYTSGYGTCGVGLPAQVIAASQITDYDGSTRTPTQDFSYDGNGNLTGYYKGLGGGYPLDSWTLGYNSDHRNVSKTENDPTIPNAAMTSHSCYYPDGSLFYTETPSQYASDSNPVCPTVQTLITDIQTNTLSPPSNAMFYQYDLDGNEVEVTSHKGCVTSVNPCTKGSQTVCNPSESSDPIGTTCKYYDGLDRLVETIEPYDTRSYPGSAGWPYEFYGFRWMNRYIYDLSQSGGTASLQIADNTGTVSGLVAYGGLYKTQEYLPQSNTMIAALSNGQYTSGAWSDVRGTSFDGLDRVIGKYELSYGTTAVTTNTWDASGEYDLLGKVVNAVGQVTHYSYDTDERLQQVIFTGTAPQADNRSYTYDPDGRIATATDSVGTMTYTYDVDGNKTSVTEAGNQNNEASLICYQYYPDDLREYVSVGLSTDTCGSIHYRANSNNGGISQNNILSYAYTHDGMLLNEQVNWGTNITNQQFTWSYTPSERELTEIDPLNKQQINGVTIGQKTYTYDPYGRVASLTLPEGWVQSSYVYDVDDELAGYTVGNTTRTLTLNARGELLEDNTNNSLIGWAQGPTYSANGAQVGNGNQQLTGGGYVQAPPAMLQLDERSNMVTCGPDPNWALEGGTNKYVETYKYDIAGRQVNVGTDQTGNCTPTFNAPTTYDGENHIQTTQNVSLMPPCGPCVYSSAAVTYGPDGRQSIDAMTANNGNPSYIAHWDGDTLLFAGQPSQGPPELYVGKSATIDSAGNIIVADRDQTGAQITSHGTDSTGAWYSGLTMGSVRHYFEYKNGQQVPINVFPSSCNGGSSACVPNMIFPMPRADGYSMVGGLVQGVRSFDPTSGQWLTPDAYAGDAEDPMSQKPFMWNGNNPLEWADPTGYDRIYLNARPAELGAWHEFVEVFDEKNNLKERISFGPNREGVRAFGSRLIREPGNYDARFSRGANGAVRQQVLHCTGASACQSAEHNIHQTASDISDANKTYWVIGNNSNGAAGTNCSAGAGAAACGAANKALGKWTPGFSQDLDPQGPKKATSSSSSDRKQQTP